MLHPQDATCEPDTAARRKAGSSVVRVDVTLLIKVSIFPSSQLVQLPRQRVLREETKDAGHSGNGYQLKEKNS